jgi:hypothetical protein
MPYPRLIKLDIETKQKLISYLNEELPNHRSERGAFIDDLISMQKDYWAKAKGTRTFPFQKASNIVIPLSAIAFEAIHARVMTTLFGLKQRVSCKAKTPDFSDVAPRLENFYADELERMRFRQGIEPSIMEIGKFGTGVGKAGYCRIVKYGMRDVGGSETEFPVIVKQGAEISSVPLSRFLMPFGEVNPQTARWCGEEHSDTEHEIYLHEEGGLFEKGTYEKLKAHFTMSGSGSAVQGDRFEQSQQESENRVPSWPTRVNWVELWMAWNVDGDDEGRRHEIVVYYHEDSQTVMGIRYNWHADLRRPYRSGVYFPLEHRWTGIGICKQNEQFQKEITTQHRQRLDNATLANMRMLVISKLSGYGPNEPVFPGKMWFVDDMTTFLESVEMTEIYPSAYNNENQSLSYSQQRTGVNDSTLGMPATGTPGTATSELQRVQEGKKKFDYTFNNIKLYVNDLLVDGACEIQQWGSRSIQFYDGEVQQILQLPETLIRDGVILEIKLAGEQENKLIDRQNWTQVASMLQSYYTNMLLLAQQLGNPQLIQAIAQKAIVAATEAMKQIAESFDMKNIDRIVFLEIIENARNILASTQATGPNAIAGGPPAGGANGGTTGQGSIITPPQAVPSAPAASY